MTTKEVTKLESPIDVMYLIHKALRAEAERVVKMSDHLKLNGGLDPFKKAFGFWISTLGYHAVNEDEYMTGPLTNSMAARENEEEHARLGGRIKEVQTCLDKEIGSSPMTARTHRHLFGRVVALQVGMEDHLEEEEEFVLPVIREEMSEEQQLGVARHLLIDEDVTDKRWIIKWMAKELTPRENNLVDALVERFEAIPSRSG